MAQLEFAASRLEVQVSIVLPWTVGSGPAWDRLTITFLDVALGGRAVWVATADYRPNLEWREIIGDRPIVERKLNIHRKGVVRVELGHTESFDERAAREIVKSSDFHWDSVFLVPASCGDLGQALEILERIDEERNTFEKMDEFVQSMGDGIALRWINPDPSRDVERIKAAGLAEGFTLVPSA